MLLLALAAHADVPPPPGIKRVPYIVKVEGMTADRDPAVVVFPWSDSDGAPTSEVGVVGPMGLQFGRRVGGQPAFWLVPRAKLTEVADLEGDAAEAWMAANGERCEGS
ncbi:MAG: hypothetical protein KC656_17200, partial [Myxococcales bacterium]|nr:hypothetical protein [Myxococcales bacterium]